MKRVLLISLLLLSTGCGYSSRRNEIIGQVKSISHQTPILCDERVDIDVSLGVTRNGTGSVSKHDVELTVPNEKDQKILKEANESGALVKITFDTKRITFCWNAEIVTSVELVK